MADPRFFKRSGDLSLTQILEITKGHLASSSAHEAGAMFEDVAPLKEAGPGHIGVLHNTKYLEELQETKAGAVILHPDHRDYVSGSVIPIFSESPYRAYAAVALAFYPDSLSIRYSEPEQPFIHPTARVGENCSLEPGVVIGPHVVIGKGSSIAANTVIGQGVTMGENCIIGPNVTISHSLIGNHVTIHAGARLGQMGFGFFMDEKGHVPVPQLGRVIIEDGVDIGANTTIDRGSLLDTHIGAGSRLDNLVQIAHNVSLGKGCVVVAQVGISGSTHVGDYVAIGGQAGLTGHLKIGRGAKIAAQSGVMRNLEEGANVGGSPAVPARLWHQQTVALKKIAEMKGRHSRDS